MISYTKTKEAYLKHCHGARSPSTLLFSFENEGDMRQWFVGKRRITKKEFEQIKPSLFHGALIGFAYHMQKDCVGVVSPVNGRVYRYEIRLEEGEVNNDEQATQPTTRG